MREHKYFDENDHNKHVQIIESILVDTKKLIDIDDQSITLTYEQTSACERPRIANKKLGFVALRSAIESINGLHSALDVTWAGRIIPDKSNHRILIRNNEDKGEKDVYCATDLFTSRRGLSRMMTYTNGNGQIHRFYGVLLAHDGNYTTVNGKRPADEKLYDSKAHSLIHCGIHNLLAPLHNGQHLNGLKFPGAFKFLRDSMIANHPNLDVDSMLNNILVRYNNSLGDRNKKQALKNSDPEMTYVELELLWKRINGSSDPISKSYK